MKTRKIEKNIDECEVESYNGYNIYQAEFNIGMMTGCMQITVPAHFPVKKIKLELDV